MTISNKNTNVIRLINITHTNTIEITEINKIPLQKYQSKNIFILL